MRLDGAAADPKKVLREKFLAFAAGLREQPLCIYINDSVYGMLDHQKLMYRAIFPALSKPVLWYDLADRLAKLLQDNATEFFLAYGRDNDEQGKTVGDADNFVMLNDGPSGPEHWPQDRQAILDKVLPFLNSNMFGAWQNRDYYNKQQWRIPRTHSYVPKDKVETAHPLLILQTTYDPVCPLVSARSANRTFEGSQISELKGYGHCTIAMLSMCIAKHVYNGTLPSNYTQCEVDGPYFIKLEDDDSSATAPRKHFHDLEGQNMHLTQVELASDSTWPL